MNKIVLLVLTVIVGSFFMGCVNSVSSAYILTMEYTNPKTSNVETIDIPVSQYGYEQAKVGDDYNVPIHTVVLGVRIPMTRSTSSAAGYVSYIVSLMIILALLVTIFLVWKEDSLNRQNTVMSKTISTLIILVIGVGFFLACIAPLQSDFTATGHIIDKTFQIVSR